MLEARLKGDKLRPECGSCGTSCWVPLSYLVEHRLSVPRFVPCQHFPTNCILCGCFDSSVAWFISLGWCRANLCAKSRTIYNLPHQQIPRTLFAISELVGPVLCLRLKELKRNRLFSPWIPSPSLWELRDILTCFLPLMAQRNRTQTLCS